MELIQHLGGRYRACLAIALAAESVKIEYIVADSCLVEFCVSSPEKC